jgi:head-tail adaptor
MRNKITIKRPNKTADTLGGNTTDFSVEYSYWADITEIAIDKVFDSGVMVYGKRYEIILRNDGIVPDITLGWKFEYNDKTLTLLNESTDRKKGFRTFQCEHAD